MVLKLVAFYIKRENAVFGWNDGLAVVLLLVFILLCTLEIGKTFLDYARRFICLLKKTLRSLRKGIYGLL